MKRLTDHKLDLASSALHLPYGNRLDGECRCDLPTAMEMADFAAQFRGSDWERLCRNPKFLAAVGSDLIEAGAIAENLLKKSIRILQI